MSVARKARPRLDTAAHQRLRDAAGDALEWLRLFDEADALEGFVAKGSSAAIRAASRERFAAAIQALAGALEEDP